MTLEVPRPVGQDDAGPCRVLVRSTLDGTAYLGRIEELLGEAERGGAECRALVVRRGEAAAALALFGPVAGSRGAWHLRTLLIDPRVDSRAVGRTMIEAALQVAASGGARLLMAELPADPVMGRSLSLLRASGFRQEARVPDFYRDGVALLFLRRDVPA